MANYHNLEVTNLIGKHLTETRKRKKLQIEDVVALTGFNRNTIISIENGANTDVSHLMEYLFALETAPEDFFKEIKFDVKPRFPLSATRKEKSNATSRLEDLIKSGFFNDGKTNEDACTELNRLFPESKTFTTKSIAVPLNRFKNKGALVYDGHIGGKRKYKTGKQN